MSGLSTDERLFAELWVSFVSLIRSYIAAHEIGRSANSIKVVESTGALSMRQAGKLLELTFNVATGEGYWILHYFANGVRPLYETGPSMYEVPGDNSEQGEFKIGDDSEVALSDRRGKLELEVAAEAFTAKVFDEE
jgi:hypothetical protein